MNNIYYVYMYLREKDSDNGLAGSPYYIGKGKDTRAFDYHNKRIQVPSVKSRIRFIKENLSEDDAFMWEVFWIAEFGRIDLGTGCLHNLTNGGEGGSGVKPTEESNKSRSKTMSGKRWVQKNKRKRVPLTASHKEHISESLLGHETSKHTRNLTSEANSGRIMSDEIVENCRTSYLNSELVECPHCHHKDQRLVIGRWHGDKCKDKPENKALIEHGLRFRKPETKKKKTYKTCPYCDKRGISYNMTRYHFDNCKKKLIP